MRIQQSIFEIILKASSSIVRLAIGVFTEKFLRPTNRFLQVALYLLLLILIVDSYFHYLLVLTSWYSRMCSHDGKNDIGSSETGISTNIVPITLKLALISFSPLGILSFLKMAVLFCITHFNVLDIKI